MSDLPVDAEAQRTSRARQNKNPGIAAGVLHFVFVERDPGSAVHRVRDDFVA
jgi:hypothetical protein